MIGEPGDVACAGSASGGIHEDDLGTVLLEAAAAPTPSLVSTT
ncbi:MAG: hypothetical protein AVDCRST_MAG34-2855 [uncultured Nocardioidaceae bacterium]|uniref:Uncharacterized protein n=1 Tax=uncultured Nocardioidaceae bacterium TaxID=253824 RepID=A0A6J4MNX4_9ACTN|nr:MAG: hypothetical protein AVDCRST_MAG34-2855 [uncultured Nocardioidaceae bacterium]